MIPLTDLKAQITPIRHELDQAWARVLNSGAYVLGEEVEGFESEFSAYCHTACTVATNSGTSALHLALLALGIGPGDEVITVAHTFVATVEAIRFTGARPVLVDVDASSNTLDPSCLEGAIGPRSKAVVPVHIYGQCADMEPICTIARRHGLAVVEDAAQAHGALYNGRPAGSLGDVACFSFYPSKNLGACGEGGAVVTDDGAVASTVRRLRDHGQSSKHQHELVGFNYRMEALQAATLRVKLRHLDDWNSARRRLAAEYRRRLEGRIGLLTEMPSVMPVHHIFPIFHDDRDHLGNHLARCGVQTGIHYPTPVHLQPAYRDLGYHRGDLPRTEWISQHELSLPIYPEMSMQAIETVAAAVRLFGSRQPAYPRGISMREPPGYLGETKPITRNRTAPFPSVSICYQAYNEEATVREVLEETEALLSGRGLDYEIILCDDGSKDATGAIADEVARSASSVRTFHHERNLGIPRTQLDLYTLAKKDFVYIDGVDRQWSIAILLDLLPLAGEWDIIVASRRQKFYGPLRAFVSYVFNLLPRMLFGVRTYDAGATKLIRRDVLFLDRVISDSPFLAAEVMIRAARAGHRITAVPVDINPRRTGRSHGISMASLRGAIRDVVRVWWALRTSDEHPRERLPAGRMRHG